VAGDAAGAVVAIRPAPAIIIAAIVKRFMELSSVIA
jgi:hypothetical protein